MTDHPAPDPNQDDALAEKAARTGYDFDQMVAVEFGQVEPLDFDSLPEWVQDAHHEKAREQLAAVGPMIAAGALREAGDAARTRVGVTPEERLIRRDPALWLNERADQIEEGRA